MGNCNCNSRHSREYSGFVDVKDAALATTTVNGKAKGIDNTDHTCLEATDKSILSKRILLRDNTDITFDADLSMRNDDGDHEEEECDDGEDDCEEEEDVILEEDEDVIMEEEEEGKESPASCTLLQKLRENPYSFRGDFEQMRTRIIRHRSEFPLRVWEAILQEAEDPRSTANPERFYTEVYEAVRSLLLFHNHDSDDDEEIDADEDTEAEVEVAVRFFPGVLRERKLLQQLEERQQQQKEATPKRSLGRFWKSTSSLAAHSEETMPFGTLLSKLEEEIGSSPTDSPGSPTPNSDQQHYRSSFFYWRTSESEDSDEDEDDTSNSEDCEESEHNDGGLYFEGSEHSNDLATTTDNSSKAARNHRLMEWLREPHTDDLVPLMDWKDRGLLRKQCVFGCVEAILCDPTPIGTNDERFWYLLECQPRLFQKRQLLLRFLLYRYHDQGHKQRKRLRRRRSSRNARNRSSKSIQDIYNDGYLQRFQTLFAFGLCYYPTEMGFVMASATESHKRPKQARAKGKQRRLEAQKSPSKHQPNLRPRVVKFNGCPHYFELACLVFGKPAVVQMVNNTLKKTSSGVCDTLQSLAAFRSGILFSSFRSSSNHSAADPEDSEDPVSEAQLTRNNDEDYHRYCSKTIQSSFVPPKETPSPPPLSFASSPLPPTNIKSDSTASDGISPLKSPRVNPRINIQKRTELKPPSLGSFGSCDSAGS